MTIDLEQQTIKYSDKAFGFVIDPVRRTRLLNGWDSLALTASYMDKIAAFKTADRARRPWALPSCNAVRDGSGDRLNDAG